MEQLQHFGLAEDPFRNEPRLRDFIDSPASREALARLDRGLRQNKGLLVLTGAVGCGKTMVVRRLLDQLEEEVFEASMLVVLNGSADANWLLASFARQLGIETPAHADGRIAARPFHTEVRRKTDTGALVCKLFGPGQTVRRGGIGIGDVLRGYRPRQKRAGQQEGAHHIAPIISRPTSMRRISDVPAPISISLASRKMRPTGLSDR